MAPPVIPQLLHSALSEIQECAPTTRASLAGRRTWALRLRWRDRRTPADPLDGRALAMALAGPGNAPGARSRHAGGAWLPPGLRQRRSPRPMPSVPYEWLRSNHETPMK